MPYADLPGVHLWYTDSGGDGVPLVLLHANTGNSESWQHNIPDFVAAGYRVIAFDRRGWGRSMADPTTGPQPGTIAGDLDALADHLKLDGFHLVGVAGGGYAVYDYALWRPERLLSVVVAASGGGIQDKGLEEMRARTRSPQFSALPAQFREVSFGYMATNPDGLRQWLDIHAQAQQKGAPSQPLRNEITYAKLETITAPALIMPADNDLTTPPFVMKEQLKHLPGAQYVLVTESAHAVNWEQPDVFDRHVLEFLAKR